MSGISSIGGAGPNIPLHRKSLIPPVEPVKQVTALSPTTKDTPAPVTPVESVEAQPQSPIATIQEEVRQRNEALKKRKVAGDSTDTIAYG